MGQILSIAKHPRLTGTGSVVRNFADGPASIYKLPRELIEQIFHECISMSFGDGALRNLETLMSVCFSWRHIGESTPTLWTTITFGLPYISGTDSTCISEYQVANRLMVNRLKIHLTRSQKAEIDLTLCCPATHLPLHLRRQSECEVFGLLRPHWYRCRTISLRDHGVDDDIFASLLLEGPFPRLRILRVEYMRYVEGKVGQILKCDSAPLLHTLDIGGHIDYGRGLESLSVELLSHVSLEIDGAHGPRTIATILARGAALKTLSLHGEMKAYDWPRHSEAYTLPCLKSLSLPDRLLDDFAQVATPSLEHIEVHGCDFATAWGLSSTSSDSDSVNDGDGDDSDDSEDYEDEEEFADSPQPRPHPHTPLSPVLCSATFTPFRLAHVHSVLEPHRSIHTVRIVFEEIDDFWDLLDLLYILLLDDEGVELQHSLLPNLRRLEIWEASVWHLRRINGKIRELLDSRPDLHITVKLSRLVFSTRCDAQKEARDALHMLKAEYGAKVVESHADDWLEHSDVY